MKVSLLTLGTRGDVQPYAVLGKAFQDRGHEVVLSTGKNFQGLASDYRLNFLPVEADFHALINSEEGKAMMKNPFLARKHFIRIVQPMMVDAMKIFFKQAQESDCVLYHAKALGDFFADQFPEKMMRANVVPAIQQTSEFPNPVFSAIPLPKILNKLTYRLADMGMAMMNGAIRQFRVNVGLGEKIPKKIEVPSVYGISEFVLPKPKDFPSNSHFTGFWQGQLSQVLDSSLIDLLKNGKRNVLVTFGSMPFETRFDLQKSIISISKELNVNVIIVKGWGFSNTDLFRDVSSIKVIDGAPYDKLLPLIHAAVHHGGIGTLAECLRSATPSLSCPVIYPMGDQYFWGTQAHKIGCSPKPIPLKKLTHQSLKENLNALLSNNTFLSNSQILSRKLLSENGPERTVDLIESKFARLL